VSAPTEDRPSTELITVYVTAADAAEAERLGAALVTERLAACANVLPGMRSIYRWEGAIARDEEAVLLLKTRAALFERLSARVRALHGYELPCVVAWPIVEASADYTAWVTGQTTV
jgi:periplasmic divalent cation tolerance protein